MHLRRVLVVILLFVICHHSFVYFVSETTASKLTLNSYATKESLKLLIFLYA